LSRLGNVSVEVEAEGAYHWVRRRRGVAPIASDLSTEPPSLLAVLAIRLGRIQRVSCDLPAWDAAPPPPHLTVSRLHKPARPGGVHQLCPLIPFPRNTSAPAWSGLSVIELHAPC